MKILFFSLNRLAFTGGAEKYILEVARVFKDKGQRVYYLGDCRPLLTLNILAAFLLGVINFKSFLVGLKDLRQASSFPNEAASFIFPRRLTLGAFLPFRGARRETRALLEGCDWVLVKNEILDMLAFFLLTIPWRRVRAALLVFSSFTYPSRSPRGRLHNFFYRSPLYAFCVRRYQRVVVSNRADIAFLGKEFKVAEEKVRYVPYGLNPDEFRADRSSDVILVSPAKPDASRIIRQLTDWTSQDDGVGRTGQRGFSVFQILFVGRLEEQKGVDILVEVIRRLLTGAAAEEALFRVGPLKVEIPRRAREKVGEMRFTIIGDGPWREKVEDLAQELPPVAYLGELPRSQVIQEYYRHDLLLVPSRWETFSYVTLEAQFCGLPVVAFNIPGPQDIIEDGKTGKLVPAGDTAGFLEAVEGYAESGVDTLQRDYIRQRAQEVFSVEKTATALLKL